MMKTSPLFSCKNFFKLFRNSLLDDMNGNKVLSEFSGIFNDFLLQFEDVNSESFIIKDKLSPSNRLDSSIDPDYINYESSKIYDFIVKVFNLTLITMKSFKFNY